MDERIGLEGDAQAPYGDPVQVEVRPPADPVEDLCSACEPETGTAIQGNGLLPDTFLPKHTAATPTTNNNQKKKTTQHPQSIAHLRRVRRET